MLDNSKVNEVNATLADEQATIDLGAKLAAFLTQALEQKVDFFSNRALSVNLEGDLGAGKTTLTRGLVQALGYDGVVKSPTYTLVESYALKTQELHLPFELYHFDLYRLLDSEELEMMGIRDYFAKRALCLIEWPDRGAYVLPKPDLTISLRYEQAGRSLTISSALFSLEQLQSLID